MTRARPAHVVVVDIVVVVALAAGLASGARAADDPEARRAKAAAAFAPWDAGAPRAVTRQGTKGKPRRAHPHVGDADKVPGEGPPPPPLRVDPDVPELVLSRGGGASSSVNTVGASLSSNPLYLASLVYSNVLTKLDGPRCGHLPTCSRFASQAVARHGGLGILMGLDRLIQPNESSAIRKLPEVEGFGGARGYDPVDNYEFWRSERFTGFPAPTKEEPLDLPPLAAPRASSPPAPATRGAPAPAAPSTASTAAQPTVPRT